MIIIMVVVVAFASTFRVFFGRILFLLLLLLFLFASGCVSSIGLGLHDQGIVRALGGIDTRSVNNRCNSEL
jgi:hypothetical protein